MPGTNDRRDPPLAPVEAAARATVELRAHRVLTEGEWAAVRARLMQFATILRCWERASARQRDNVGLCHREQELRSPV
jgi:hypothetical protein